MMPLRGLRLLNQQLRRPHKHRKLPEVRARKTSATRTKRISRPQMPEKLSSKRNRNKKLTQGLKRPRKSVLKSMPRSKRPCTRRSFRVSERTRLPLISQWTFLRKKLSLNQSTRKKSRRRSTNKSEKTLTSGMICSMEGLGCAPTSKASKHSVTRFRRL